MGLPPRSRAGVGKTTGLIGSGGDPEDAETWKARDVNQKGLDAPVRHAAGASHRAEKRTIGNVEVQKFFWVRNADGGTTKNRGNAAVVPGTI